MFGKRKVAALMAEFLGTASLTLLVLSIQRSSVGFPFFIAIGAGVTIALLTFALRDSSGAHFNPALTVALWTARKVSTLRAVLYVAVQMLGAWAAYGLYTYYVNTTLQPIGGHFVSRILIAEAVGSAVFAFGVAAAIYRGVTVASQAAYTGMAYLVGVVVTSSTAIGLLNPAVALGTRAWVWGTYVLGPVLGAVVGVNLYGLLFAEPAAVMSDDMSTTAGAAAPARAAVATKATKAKVVAKKPAAKKPVARKKTTK